ncbi:MAG TPA: ECF transporter S component [Paludibacter sp.]|nr:ECF transporter S component [Paludibacter sp.]
MTSTAKLYSYDYRTAKTYIFASAFIAGNLLLPQLAHLVPNGGLMFLPIYFFTLIASYKYGIKVGLLTAVLSPLINSMLFGMPMMALIPIIIAKSSLLAFAAGFVAKKTGTITLINLVLVVLAYQVVGTAIEWIALGSLNAALQDFRIGFPGMLLQIFGGYLVLKAISKV